ncbi:hypothetical protein BT67DRAFT_440826, partial [Trichocladium antarcticum]
MSFFKKLADLGDDISRLGLGSNKNARKDEAHSTRNYEGKWRCFDHTAPVLPC